MYSTYNFSFKNKPIKILSKIMSLCLNLFYSFLIIIILLFPISKLNSYIAQQYSPVVIKIEWIIMLLIVLSFIVLTFIPQKVIVCEDVVKINRYCIYLSPLGIFRGINDKINISSIEKVYHEDKKNVSFEYLPVMWVDWENLVAIKTDKDIYYIPIEHSERFINEMLLRCADDSSPCNKGDGSLC